MNITSVKHVLPPLPYDAAALEPHVDARTMELHHDKHHATCLHGEFVSSR